jgi:hypothetical protein
MALQKHAGAVRLFARMLKFSAWLQQIPNMLTPPPFRLMQMGSAFWQSRALYVAARLDIASALADERLPAEEIAVRVSAHPDATYRLLRMLVAMGIFEEASPRHFKNNKLSSFLRGDNPQNVRAMILMHNSEVMSRPWCEYLEQGVREGTVPFSLAHGEDLFDFMDTHPEFDALFSRAMDSVELLIGDSFATDFDWGQFARVIDVGGSRGSKAVTLLKHYPHLTALVVDRAQVIADAEGCWTGRVDAAVLARLRFQAGDVLEAVPAATTGKDIYLLSAVLHGFDDDNAVKVLRSLARAMGDTGARVVLLELVVPDAGADLASTSFDMQMFMGTRGRERTQAEWERLFERSGLRLDELVSLRSFGKLLVLRHG